MKEMQVTVWPSQFQLLQECVAAFEDGRRGPHGWTPDTVREQLSIWAMLDHGHYDLTRHLMGEPVRIQVRNG